MAGQRLTPPAERPARHVPEEPFYDVEEETRERVATPDQEVAAEGELITELTEEERKWFDTLLTVGRRSRTVTVFGHSVVVQNLTTDDDLRIGLFCKEFLGAPPAEQRAYQLATCAAGVRSIDGQELFQPLGNVDPQEIFEQKLARLREYYPVVITQIYREILSLDGEFMELAQKLGKHVG